MYIETDIYQDKGRGIYRRKHTKKYRNRATDR